LIGREEKTACITMAVVLRRSTIQKKRAEDGSNKSKLETKGQCATKKKYCNSMEGGKLTLSNFQYLSQLRRRVLRRGATKSGVEETTGKKGDGSERGKEKITQTAGTKRRWVQRRDVHLMGEKTVWSTLPISRPKKN